MIETMVGRPPPATRAGPTLSRPIEPPLPRRIPDVNQPSDRQDCLNKITHSPSYRLAYEDIEFLNSPRLRAARMELEFLKPDFPPWMTTALIKARLSFLAARESSSRPKPLAG